MRGDCYGTERLIVLFINSRDDNAMSGNGLNASRQNFCGLGGTLCKFIAWPLVLSLFVLLAAGAVRPVHAQSSDLRSGGLNPFPKNDIYRMHLFGDWFMDGLEPALAEIAETVPRIQFHGEKVEIQTLRRTSWLEVLEQIKARAKSIDVDMAVVMFGVNEIGSVFVPGGAREQFGSEAWLKIYASRVDDVMKALRLSKGAVYWISLPVVRRRDHSEAYQVINALVRERAYANGVTIIDVFSRFQDENGGFNRYGPDLDGNIKSMRTKDGIYFTSFGNAKIAHLVMQMVRRDLNSVKAEQVVSLDGDAAEQSSVRRLPPATSNQQSGGAANTRANYAMGPGSLPGRGMPYAGQKADNGSFQFELLVNGKPSTVTLKLPRPALSAAVMTLVTRNQSKDEVSRLGDNAVQVIEGGVPLLSTVTPADQSAYAIGARRLSPTQSVFFKVWGKGERLDPKPGRADDYQWPRPEPEPVVHVAAKRSLDADRGGVELQAVRDPNLPPLPVQAPRI